MATLFELKQFANQMQTDVKSIGAILNVEQKKERLAQVENELLNSWQDVKLCATLSKEKTMLSNTINDFETLNGDVSNLVELLQLPESDFDAEMLADAEKTTTDLMGSNYELGRINNILNDLNFKNITFLNYQ